MALAAAGMTGIAAGDGRAQTPRGTEVTRDMAAQARAGAPRDAPLAAKLSAELESLTRLTDLGRQPARSVDVRGLSDRVRQEALQLEQGLDAYGMKQGWGPRRRTGSSGAESTQTRAAGANEQPHRVAELERLAPRAFNLPFLDAFETEMASVKDAADALAMNTQDAELRATMESFARRLEVHRRSTSDLRKLFDGPTPMLPRNW